MNIVITGSIGNIGRPLTKELIQRGHSLTVISSKAERQNEIEQLGARAAIGTIQDADFLTKTFAGADILYLMEAWEGIGSMFDKNIDFVSAFKKIANNYKKAVEQSGVKRVIHLSSIGAHTDKGTGSLFVHHMVENILKELPADVSIKFMRPVGFYTNIFRQLQNIKTSGALIQSYGGDQKEPWVSPLDIAATIVAEMEKPFEGRTVHYIASEEVSPNEVAKTIGDAIGQPDLKISVIPSQQIHEGMLSAGMNKWIADGFVAMQTAQENSSLYEDYYRHQPVLGKVKLAEFAKEFAQVYHQQTK